MLKKDKSMINFLFIIVANFRDGEYFTPKEILEKAGVEVQTASFQKGEVIGVEGGKVMADLSIDNINSSDFAGVAFIGGMGMVPRIADQPLIDLAKTFYNTDKIVAAICIAPMILANAGILKGKNATICAGAENDLQSKGAIYNNQIVVVDGNIVTAQGPSAAEEFGQKIVEMLNG